MMNDRIIFIGPDCWGEKNCPYFTEDADLYPDWKAEAGQQGLKVKVGRWNIPGNPIAILVDFTPYFAQKDQIYTWLWENYQVDSLHAYGDYARHRCSPMLPLWLWRASTSIIWMLRRRWSIMAMNG